MIYDIVERAWVLPNVCNDSQEVPYQQTRSGTAILMDSIYYVAVVSVLRVHAVLYQ